VLLASCLLGIYKEKIFGAPAANSNAELTIAAEIRASALICEREARSSAMPDVSVGRAPETHVRSGPGDHVKMPRMFVMTGWRLQGMIGGASVCAGD
jgi:hypothetical protein